MIYYIPQEPRNLRQTNVPTLYARMPVHSTVPVTEKHILALFQADQALKRMTGLSVDWEELGAEPPNDTALEITKSILSCIYMMGLEPTLVTASASSGVGICFKKGAVYADFECFNSGEITSSLIDADGNTYSWEVGTESGEVIDAIRRIEQNIDA